MIERVHGIDRHKQFSTISVLNSQGEEVHFAGACREFGKYVEGLGPTDVGVPGGFDGILLVGGSDRSEGGEVLRGGSAEVSDHQGLVEQDGQA